MHIQMIDRHLADFARFANPAGFVNHRDLMAWIGFAHAAGLGRPESVAVAHDVVDLGLAKHFIDLHAQLLITPQIHRITHGLARAHERFKLEFERFPRLGKRLHHRFERGGKEKRVRDPMGLQNIKGQLRRETAIACNDFPPEIQAGQQRVHQAARPSPVCGAPEYRFGGSIGLAVKAKPVLARHKTRQIPQQGAVRNQGAFGRARGAAGVDQNGCIVCTGLHQRKLCWLLAHFCGVVHIRLRGCRADAHDLAQTRALRANGLHGLNGAFIHEGYHRARVIETVLQSLWAKQHRQRHRHRPHLHHRHVGHRRLQPLRQHNRHAVAAPHAQTLQQLAELIGLLGELPVGQRFMAF